MDSSEVLGNTATYGGAFTACASAPAALSYESNMLFFLSALGAMISLLGLAYTVYNGNRHYRLALAQLELERAERLGALTAEAESVAQGE